jgi:hypothetical protein
MGRSLSEIAEHSVVSSISCLDPVVERAEHWTNR